MPFSTKTVYLLKLNSEEVGEVNKAQEGRRSLCVSSCSCTEDPNVVTWVSSPISRALKGGSYQNRNSASAVDHVKLLVVPHLIWNFTKKHLFSFLLKHLSHLFQPHASSLLLDTFYNFLQPIEGLISAPCILDVPLESLPFTWCS